MLRIAKLILTTTSYTDHNNYSKAFVPVHHLYLPHITYELAID